MSADVIYGDKTVGACVWVFFKDGESKQTQKKVLHIIRSSSEENQSNSSVKLHQLFTWPSIFVEKRRNIRNKG